MDQEGTLRTPLLKEDVGSISEEVIVEVQPLDLTTYPNAEAVPSIEVYTDFPRKFGQAIEAGGVTTFSISPNVVDGLRQLSLSSRGLQEVLLAAWVALLARYSGAESLVVWCNDSGPAAKPSHGVEVDTDAAGPQGATWQGLLNQVRSESTWRSPAGLSAFQTGFSFCGRARLEGASAAGPDLWLMATEARGGVEAALSYCSLFSASTADIMAAHYSKFLESVAAAARAEPEGEWRRWAMMRAEEERAVTREWSVCTHMHVPQDEKTVADLFCDQVRSTPDGVAVTYGGMSWSYRQLYGECAAVAEALMQHGVQAESNVVLYMERSGSDMVAAIFGTLLAGGGYVPIDPEYPMERVEDIVSDCAPAAMVTQAALAWKLKEVFPGPIVDLDAVLRAHHTQPASTAPALPPEGVPSRQGSDDTLYVFYTSGSTGKPKGVIVEHRAMVRRSRWLQTAFPLDARDRILQKTPYVFGVSEWEFFWPLLVGAQLVVCPPESHKHAEYMFREMQAEQITVSFFVPSMLNVFIEATESVPEGQLVAGLGRALPAMRHVILAGEGLPPALCEAFHHSGVFPSATLDNLYGPTEAEMTHWQCPKLAAGDPAPPVLIGRPIANAEVYVLDDKLRPVPIHVPGEICFGGRGVSRGYLNRPELTEKAFVENPYGEGRLYRTGDLGMFLADGQMRCMGRMDSQIKLRGLRIELGEIETGLASAPGITAAAVLKVGEGLTAALVAYVRCAAGSEVFERPESALAHLRTRVPEYMVPTYILRLDRFPFNTNGKLDRKKLPVPAPMRAQMEAQAAGPQPGADAAARAAPGDIASTVEGIWCEVLGLPAPLDPDMDFQKLGGNSLLAGRVTHLIRKRIAPRVAATSVYRHATIRDLAAYLQSLPEDERMAAGKAGAGADKAPPATKDAYRGCSSSSLGALWLTISGLLLSCGVGDFVYWPAYGALYAVYYRYGVFMCFAMIAPLLAATVVAFLLLTLVLKWLLLGKCKPGRYPLWGWFYMRWWVVRNLVTTSEAMIQAACADTPLLPIWWRLLGAQIGKGVQLGARVNLSDADLLDIGDYAVIRRFASLLPYSVENGCLVLRRVVVGAGCDVQPRAYVAGGTALPPHTLLGPLSTTGPGAHSEQRALSRDEQARLRRSCGGGQAALRCSVGLAVVVVLQTLPFVPAIYLMQLLWYPLAAWLGGDQHDSHGEPRMDDGYWNAMYVFSIVLPWIDLFLLPELYFYTVVLFKRLVIGRFRPGPRSRTTWDDFKRWLLEALITSDPFQHAMAPWVSSELLSVKMRLMGARIGRRVQIDFFYIVEYDLIEVADNVTFGSSVVVCPADDDDDAVVRIGEEANVLDHCLLMPGVQVEEEAMLGTYTLAPKGAVYRASSINTGNEGGRSVYLRQQYKRPLPGEEPAASKPTEPKHLKRQLSLPPQPTRSAGPASLDDPTEIARLAALARDRHNSTFHWVCLNLYIMTVTFVIVPLPDVLAVATVALDAWAYTHHNSSVLAICILPPALVSLGILELAFYWLMKWLVVGHFKEGNHTFYSVYHYKWILMMVLRGTFTRFSYEISGTALAAWFARAMGGDIGDDVCLLNFVMTEFDLLTVGKGSSVGDDCDLSAHTVERMVIQLRHVTVKKQCSIRNDSVVMPGAVVQRRGTLLEGSQVLKGDTVSEREVWAGLPAQPVGATPPSELRRIPFFAYEPIEA